MIVAMHTVSKSFGSQLVFSELTAQINERNRIGLVGVNGAGKTTLLNLIVGELYPEQGTISRNNQRPIGFLRQNNGLTGGTIQQEMELVFADLFRMEETMRSLEQAMAAMAGTGEPTEVNPQYQELAAEYSLLQAQFESREGYLVPVKISTVLNGMGFEAVSRDTPTTVLSGGEQTRLAICKLLLEQPELLILDEPTNHLDFKTLVWLEGYLSSYPAALLIVSHDRYFLNVVCETIWEMQNQNLTEYKGNYDKYLALKQEKEALQRKTYGQQQEVIADMEDFIARNIVRASTTKRAQSRRKALEKMDKIEAPKLPPKPPFIRFSHARDPVKDVLAIENLALSVGEGDDHKELFTGLNLTMTRGEKIALIGFNGVGKSSLLKAMVGKLTPVTGSIEWGRNTDISYFDQGVGDLTLESRAIDELWRAFPQETEHSIRSVLGHAGLRGDDVFKKVSALSGGEKARLKFAHFMMECGNVLLMDEPTNHLDLPTKEVLDTALQEYTGTLLVVSHDRYLLNKFPDKIAELHPDGLIIYDGKYDDYKEIMNAKDNEEEARRQLALSQQRRETTREKKSSTYRTREERRQDAEQRKALVRLEEEILQAEKSIATLEAEMAQPDIASDYEIMQVKCATLDSLREALDTALEEWTGLLEESE